MAIKVYNILLFYVLFKIDEVLDGLQQYIRGNGEYSDYKTFKNG